LVKNDSGGCKEDCDRFEHPSATHLPSLSGQNEARIWDVQRVKVRQQDALLEGIDLRIGFFPALLRAIAIFADPVVFVGSGIVEVW
jgi:hypothetical protein